MPWDLAYYLIWSKVEVLIWTSKQLNHIENFVIKSGILLNSVWLSFNSSKILIILSLLIQENKAFLIAGFLENLKKL